MQLARTRTDDDESLAIIDQDSLVHMATHGHPLHSLNQRCGSTAYGDPEEIQNCTAFMRLYPEKFNNKTNGITFRRWLLECDPRLTARLEQYIGSGFRKDASELEKLLTFADDETVLNELTAVKKLTKKIWPTGF